MADASAQSLSGAAPSASDAFWRRVGVGGTLLGAFMAILDIQIVNASIADIQGTLGATLDEGSWISTAYLVAEIIIIPMAGWLASVFSIRRYLIITSFLFLFFSCCCAWATSLPAMILFRALQGLFGGALIPLAMLTLLTILAPSERPVALAFFGLSATLAPAVGPTVGGYLTYVYGWPYIFYINLIPGVILIAAVWRGLPQTSPKLELLKRIDYPGIISMAIGLGSFTVFIEEGNRKDWFGSAYITRLAIVSVVFLIAFVVIELTGKDPFINLKLIGRRAFGLSVFINSTVGLALYGSVFMLPLYLSQIQHYNALQIGQAMLWLGLPQLLIMPFLPKFMAKIDLRILIGFGMFMFALSSFMNSNMSHNTDIMQIRWSQLIRALGQPFIIIPLSQMATANLEREQAGSASGIFNMTRNLGGSMGIALLATLLTRREQFHSSMIGESVTAYSPTAVDRLNQIQQTLVGKGNDPVTALRETYGAMSGMIRQEAFVMSYNDCFFIIGCALTVGLALVFLLPKVKPAGGGADAH